MTDTMSAALERVRPDALRPHPNNARKHSKKQLQQIAASMTRFGFTNPILVDDSNQIIAGHGRFEAAKLLGLETVLIRRLSGMSDADLRAYLLADNRLAEKAHWDRKILQIELQTLVDLDFDLEAVGFETAELDIILGEAAIAGAPAGSPDDDVPEVPASPPVTHVGDIWRLGDHRLVCGDARSPETFASLMQGETAGMVLTDPPYNVRVVGHVGGSGSIRHRNFAMAAGEMSPEEFTTFLRTIFENAAAVSRDGSLHFTFMDWRHLRELQEAGHAVYSNLLNVCVWTKSNGGMGSLYRSQHEFCFVWKNGSAARHRD